MRGGLSEEATENWRTEPGEMWEQKSRKKDLCDKDHVKELEYFLRFNGQSLKIGFSEWIDITYFVVFTPPQCGVSIPLYISNNLFKVIIKLLGHFKRNFAWWEGHLKLRRKPLVIKLEKTRCQKGKERKKYILIEHLLYGSHCAGNYNIHYLMCSLPQPWQTDISSTLLMDKLRSSEV